MGLLEYVCVRFVILSFIREKYIFFFLFFCMQMCVNTHLSTFVSEDAQHGISQLTWLESGNVEKESYNGGIWKKAFFPVFLVFLLLNML